MNYNNIGIHITDGQITIFNQRKNNFVIGPFCSIKRSKVCDDNCVNYTIYYPFRGSVVVDYYESKKIFKLYLRDALPRFHSRTSAYFAVSPISGMSEILVLTKLCKFHKTYISYEPIIFLHGIGETRGFVVSLNRTMFEVSYVEDGSIQKYKWKYITELVEKLRFQELYHIIISTLSEIKDGKNTLASDKIYLIGDSDIANNILSLSNQFHDEFENASNISNLIIAKNAVEAPKLEW